MTYNVGLLAEEAALAVLSLIGDLKVNKMFVCFIVALQLVLRQELLGALADL
jgi:hypothetical protein